MDLCRECGVDRPLEDVDSIKAERADAPFAVKADERSVHEPDVDLEGVCGVGAGSSPVDHRDPDGSLEVGDGVRLALPRKHAGADELRARAESLLAGLAPLGLDVFAAPSHATTGGGGAPGLVLPSTALSLPVRYADPLRSHDPAVVGRIHARRLLLDLRSVPPELDRVLHNAIAWASGQA